MKPNTCIVLAALLGFPVLSAQTPPPAARQDPYVAPPPAAGEAAAAEAPRNLSLRVEDFSLDLATAAELVRADLGDEELYRRLIAMVGKKEARQESMTVIRTRSGNKALGEGILETLYATEYEPPELPNTVGVSISPPKPADGPAPDVVPETDKLEQAVKASQLGDLRTPATPTSFECRNSGRSIEVEPTASADWQTIDLRISTDNVLHAGTTKHGQGLSLVEMPEFERQHIITAVTVIPGQPFLLGTVNRPPNSKLDADAANRIWFAFVTAAAGPRLPPATARRKKPAVACPRSKPKAASGR
jgi:hypothetical protein